MEEIGLYVIITNPSLPCKRIAEICVEKGIKMLQLRDKFSDDKTLLTTAKEIQAIVKGSCTKFIINDRLDIALLADADGVHLGQDDISIEDARRILGNDKIIGLSTHSLEQARIALAKNPSYIGFGPIYPTPTKQIADPVVGTSLLKEVLEIAEIPVVAIGGIDENTAIEVIEAGAKTFCAVRYLMECEQLAERIDYINSMMKDNN